MKLKNFVEPLQGAINTAMLNCRRAEADIFCSMAERKKYKDQYDLPRKLQEYTTAIKMDIDKLNDQ